MMIRSGEASRRIGVTYVTLREYVKKGLIPAMLLPSGQLLFQEEDVEEFILKCHSSYSRDSS